MVLPLQRLGHNVWPVHTAMLSNHAAYPDHGGSAVPAGELADVIDALYRRGALARCNAVLSGYLGDAAKGDVVLDAVARVRKNNNSALYCCDPVMGDDGAVYVADDIPQFMRDLAAPAADVLTPNLFELAVLTDSSPEVLAGASLGEIVAVAKKLVAADRRTSTVLITSLAHAGLLLTEVAMAAVTVNGAWLVTTPKLAFEAPPRGAGDCCAALFCAALLAGSGGSGDTEVALSQTASAIYALLHETARLGRNELALVEAQELMLSPAKIFSAESLT